MNNTNKLLTALAVVIIGGFVTWTAISYSIHKSYSPSDNAVACTLEAKICPDGTAVGRVGPSCEFAACPGATTTATSTKTPTPPVATTTKPVAGQKSSFTVGIKQTFSALGVTITPSEVASDSRCPKNVNCVWAGTVTVKANVVIGSQTSKVTFELGKTMTVGNYNITLAGVAPEKNSSTPIQSSDYRFTFEIVVIK